VAVGRLAQTVCAACVLVAVGVAVLGFVAAERSHLLGDGGDAALGKSFLNGHTDESLIGNTSSLSSRFRRFGLRFRKMHMDPSGIGGWEQTYCAPRS